MKPLREYHDYRAFLGDYYEERRGRSAFFSIRYMASKVGMDPGFLMKIIQGKMHLSRRYLEPVCELLRFVEEERAFFEALIRYNRARTKEEIEHCYQDLLRLRKVDALEMNARREAYYANWHCSALRGILGLAPYKGGVGELGRLCEPPLGADETRAALDILLGLGLIRLNAEGAWEVTHRHVRAGDGVSPQTLRRFQGIMMRQAGDALERVPRDLRNISSVTLALARKDLPALEERINQFRADLIRLVDESDHNDTIYQLNIQLFPLSQVPALAKEEW